MIATDTMILIVFRCINFGVLIGIAWYCFNYYGLPSIRQALAEYYTYFEDLLNAHYNLQREQRIVEQAITDNRKEQDKLKERLMRWKASVEAHNKQLFVQKEERKKKLKEHLLEQQKRINQHRIFKIALSQSLAESRNVLIKMVDNKNVQHKIFDSIIVKMSNE